MSLPSLIWCIPTYGTIHRRVYTSHLTAMGSLAKNGIVCTPKSVVVTGKMGLASASNELTKVALELKPDYVFWCEQDMLLPHDAVTKLLRHAQQYNIDVLSGVYFLRGSAQPCLYKRSPRPNAPRFAHAQMTMFPENSIFPVDVPGVGCVLFKTDVFRKIDEPWWDDQEGKCGQDMYFYTRLREAGVQVYADSSVICDQIDDDEPAVYGYQEYLKWREKNGGAGFIEGSVGSGVIQLPDSERSGDKAATVELRSRLPTS